MEYRNLKSADISRLTGIGKSSISQWLSGKYEAKQDKTFELSKILNVNPAWLMGANVPMIDESISSEINDIILKLDNNNQKKVLEFAKKQLTNQKHMEKKF